MYELDLSGRLPANLVTAERQIIANVANQFRCFIPAFAPFFADSLHLTQIVSGKSNQLLEGIHYSLSHYYAEGEVATKKRLYGSVMLLSPMTGVLEFSQYQTLGGSSSTSKVAIAKHLGDPALIDPRNIDWAEVLKISTVDMALSPPSTYGEAIGTDEIIAAIEGMNQVLTQQIGGTQDQTYLEIQHSIAMLHQRMVSEGYYTHWDDHTAHGVSVATLGAYGKDETVEDALKAFGMTLDELATYCRQTGVTEATIQSYLDKYTPVKGQLRVNATNPIQAPGSGVVITENDDGTTVSALGAVTVTADKGQSRAGIAASFHSGTHIMSAYSAGSNYRTDDAFTLDGYQLITKESLADYLDGLSASAATLNLKIKDTATVNLTGNGTVGAPLKGDVSFPVASSTKKGMLKVTNTVANMPPLYGCSTRILYELDKTVSQFALGIYTLNGKALSADVTLTLADFGLGAVNNTTLAMKPVSRFWTAAVAGKAVAGHKHQMDVEYQHASPTKTGTVMLTSTRDKAITDRAATVGLAKQYQQELTTEIGKSIKILIGRTLQLGQVPASAPRIIKNGMFIAFEVS